jgi:hypothetical protein
MTDTEPGLDLTPATDKRCLSEATSDASSDAAAKALSNAERQRRYRDRRKSRNEIDDGSNGVSNEGSNGGSNEGSNDQRDDERCDERYVRRFRDMVLCAPQDGISITFDEVGGATIKQDRRPDEDVEITIHRDNVQTFLDKLCDALGVPTLGG